MKKLLVIVVALVLLSGCTSNNNASQNEKSNKSITNSPTNAQVNEQNNSVTDYPTNTPINEQNNKITNDANDYIKVYNPLINKWKSALNSFRSGNNIDYDLSFDFYSMSDPNTAEAYYALYDIDGNGTPELILEKVKNYEEIIAYIFTIKDGKTINIFGNDGEDLREVPWSRDGSSAILSNGLIDSTEGDYSIYRIADDGCSITKVASSEPYDYPDEASKSEAKWRYYVNNAQVNYDTYVQYLKEHGYTLDGENTPAAINWVEIEPKTEPTLGPTTEPSITNSPEITTNNINPDYLIIPGVSLGKIKLNMDVKQVIEILGNPSKKNSESITYYSKNKKNYIQIFLIEDKVSEVIFTSSSFETIDGDRIDINSNLEVNADKYNAWKFQWLLMQIRYTLKEGGLTFYTFNVDTADDNSEHPRSSIGILHKGKSPQYTPIEDANWEKWDGDLADLYN